MAAGSQLPPSAYAPPPTAPPGPAYVPPPPQTPKSHVIIYAVVAVVVVVIIGGLAAALYFEAHNNAKPSPVTIEHAGTVQQIQPDQDWGASFHLNAQATITGAFTVSGGSVTAYVMNPTSYQNATAGTGQLTYYWTSGSVTSGNVNAVIPTGTWYLVFVNFGATSVSLDITQALVASAT